MRLQPLDRAGDPGIHCLQEWRAPRQLCNGVLCNSYQRLVLCASFIREVQWPGQRLDDLFREALDSATRVSLEQGTPLSRLRLDKQLCDGFTATIELMSMMWMHQSAQVPRPGSCLSAQLHAARECQRHLDRMVGVNLDTASRTANP